MSKKVCFEDKAVVVDKGSQSCEEAMAMFEEMGILVGDIKEGIATPAQKEKFARLADRFKGLLEADGNVKRAFVKTQLPSAVAGDFQAQLNLARESQVMVLCFVIDGTGSMSSWINGVKRQAVATFEEYVKFYGPNLRIGCVVYRDHGLKNPLQTYQFDSDFPSFQRFIDGIEASTDENPGETRDEPEDVDGGLRAALSMHWNCAGGLASRVLVHIADAPAHGSRYNSGWRDRYGDHSHPLCGDPVSKLRRLKELGVHYYFCRLSEKTDQMISAFKDEMGCKYVNSITMKESRELANTVMRTMSSSVLKSFQSNGGGFSQFGSQLSAADSCASAEDMQEKGCLPEPEDFDETRTPHVVESAPPLSCKISVCVPIKNSGELSKRCPIRTGYLEGHHASFNCKIDMTPFADGKCRWAFHGQIQTGEGWKPYVFKRSKRQDGKAWATHTRANYLNQIKVSAVAVFLADAWNAKKPARLLPIQYLRASVAEVSMDGREELYCQEPLLPAGTFTKWCNNAALWDVGEMTENETILQFAKFTHDLTDGYMMIADIQGIKLPGTQGYVLTDPVVLCKDEDLFMPTNLGPMAMRANRNKIDQILAGKF